MSTDRLEQEIRGDIESLEKLLEGTGSSVDDYRGIARSRVRHLLNIIDRLRSADPGVAVAPPPPDFRSPFCESCAAGGGDHRHRREDTQCFGHLRGAVRAVSPPQEPTDK